MAETRGVIEMLNETIMGNETILRDSVINPGNKDARTQMSLKSTPDLSG